MVNAPAAQLGPCARAALAQPVDGSKRRKVLALIGVFADTGRPDPSISELAARSDLDRETVVAVVDRLEADGLLDVRRGDVHAGDRNVYAFRFLASPQQPERNPPMTDPSLANALITPPPTSMSRRPRRTSLRRFRAFSSPTFSPAPSSAPGNGLHWKPPAPAIRQRSRRGGPPARPRTPRPSMRR